MTYAASSDYLEYANISTYDSDDELRWTNHITRAQAVIDHYTRRTFEAVNDGVVGDSDNPVTRYFNYLTDVDGRTLFLDKDICEISTVKYGDSDGTTTTDYVTEPRNETPYFAINILDSANIEWTYDSDPESGIEVAGIWSYSKTVPADIKYATLLIVDQMEKRRTSPVDLDRPAIAEGGIMVLGVQMPPDAKAILDSYARMRFA